LLDHNQSNHQGGFWAKKMGRVAKEKS